MSVLQALKSAQFVTDTSGHRSAVLLDYEAWQHLITWFEDQADRIQAGKLLEPHLKHLDQSQALGWKDVRSDWLKDT